MQLSIWNLKDVQEVKCRANKVFVFENPTVFSEVLHKLMGEKISLICTDGQIKLASLILLDKAREGGATIFYSGDVDPEGLVIADKLKGRYGDGIKLWRYTLDTYEKIKSNELLSKERLSKLRRIKDYSLAALSRRIFNDKVAGYEELDVDEIVKGIRKEMISNHI